MRAPCGPDGRDTSGRVMAGTVRTEPDNTLDTRPRGIPAVGAPATPVPDWPCDVELALCTGANCRYPVKDAKDVRGWRYPRTTTASRCWQGIALASGLVLRHRGRHLIIHPAWTVAHHVGFVLQNAWQAEIHTEFV